MLVNISDTQRIMLANTDHIMFASVVGMELNIWWAGGKTSNFKYDTKEICEHMFFSLFPNP